MINLIRFLFDSDRRPSSPTIQPDSSNFHSQILQFSLAIVESYETGGGRRSQKRDKVHGDESFGTDFTNKCRRLNAGMSQDGSLSLNHRLPAAFLPLRPAALLLRQLATAVSNCPLPPERRLASSFSCSTSLSRRLSTFASRTKKPREREREKERERPIRTGSTGNLPHAYVRLPLLSPSERSLRQRQPNPPRNSDAISTNGDVQALIRYGESVL